MTLSISKKRMTCQFNKGNSMNRLALDCYACAASPQGASVNFGRLEIGRAAAEARKRRLTLPEIGDISNLDEEGRLRQREDRRRLDSLGNRLWHTDASYMPVPVVLGMLYAVAVPPASPLGGGETEFADMRAAYDALPEPMKDEIGGLIAEHDIFLSRGQIGFTDFLPGEREKYPPATPSAAP